MNQIRFECEIRCEYKLQLFYERLFVNQ